jgi:Ion channel
VTLCQAQPTLAGRLKAVCLLIWRQNLRPLWQIWTDRYPEEQPKRHTCLEKIFFTFPLFARSFSLSNFEAFFSPGSPSHFFIDIYLLVWVIGLSLLLFYSPLARWFTIGAAIYRIVDILSDQLCILLVESQKPSWRLASVRRSVLSAMLNFYELVVAYALLFFHTGTIVFNIDKQPPIENAGQAFYYSLVTMATLGYGELVPGDDLSRKLVIAELITEITFLVAIIPAFIAAFTVQLGGRELHDLGKRQ